MECAEFLKRIEAGNVPPAIAIVGTDAYWSKMVLDAVTGLCDSLDTAVIDEGATLKDIVIDLGTIPFVSAYRVVIVRGYAKATEKDRRLMEEYLANPNPTSVLVFECKCDFKGVECVNCDKIYGTPLIKETEKIISTFGKKATSEVITTLIDYCESDMSKIHTECLKLCAYADGDITLSDLNVCVEPSVTYKSYNFVKYLVAGDYVSCYDSINKNGDKGTIIIASLIKAYRCALYLKQRCDNNTLAKVFDMKPYQINIAKSVMNKYTAGALYGLLQLFYKLELDIKSGVTAEDQALVIAVSESIERRIK